MIDRNSKLYTRLCQHLALCETQFLRKHSDHLLKPQLSLFYSLMVHVKGRRDYQMTIINQMFFISTTRELSVKRIYLQALTLVGPPKADQGSGPSSCTTTRQPTICNRQMD